MTGECRRHMPNLEYPGRCARCGKRVHPLVELVRGFTLIAAAWLRFSVYVARVTLRAVRDGVRGS